MSPPIHLVYLLQNLNRGGVQVGALLQIPRLNKTKYRVEAWTLRCGRGHKELAAEFEQQGITVRETPVESLGDKRGILDLSRRLIRERVCLLNTKSFYANIVGRVAARIAQTPAVVANYHHPYDHHWKLKYIACERMVRDCTQTFICVSRWVKGYLQPLLGLPEERIEVLYNGFDVERYNLDRPKEELRAALQLPARVPIIVLVARLVAAKDIPTFLRAVPHIARAIPNVCCLVVGDGDQRKALTALAAELRLGNAVQFLGSRGDVPEILNAVDCLVLPSLTEGFGRVIVEAFASRTPVVATPAGGVTEIVEDGKNGLLVPFSDPERLAQAVVRTLSSPEETRRRCDQAFRDVRQFDLKTWVEKTEAIFDRAIRNRRGEIEAYLDAPVPSSFSLSAGYYRLQFGFHLEVLRRRMFG